MLATQHPTPAPTHHPHPPPLRTNADLNLSVLRRHNHHITSILSIAPYAVIYTFNPASQTWEKSGIEGSLFVCQSAPELSPDGTTLIERYTVHVLNRRGLDNFSLELTTPDEIEVTAEYIILQGTTTAVVPFPPAEEDLAQNDDDEEEAAAVIYGLWVFAEPEPSSTASMREINAQVIMDCAVRAEQSRAVGGSQQMNGEVEEDIYGQGNEEDIYGQENEEESQPQQSAYEDQHQGQVYEQRYTNGHHQQYQNVFHGRQMEQESQRQRLLGLFGGPVVQPQVQPQQQQPHNGYNGYGHSSHHGNNQQPQQDVLLDLFRRARQGQSNG